MYLSAISHTHGDQRLVSDLEETGSDDPRLKQDLLERYRASSATGALEMACEVGARTLGSVDVPPDVIVYATESDVDVPAVDAGERIANALGHPSTVVLSVAGHGCGNLGLLVQVARGLLNSSPTVLLITSDRVVFGPRMMSDGLSILSDGAAAVLATRDPPTAGLPTFLVRGHAVRVDARHRTSGAGMGAQRRTVQLGRRAVAALDSTPSPAPKDFTWALFNNYRLSSQKFLCGAAGFSVDQLLPGPVPEYAHAFAADLLVNCDLLSRAGSITAGDRLALSATGPHSWALIDIEVRSS